MSKYSDVGKRMSRHKQITHVSSTFGRITFSIPERNFEVLRFISQVLDEKDVVVDWVDEQEDGVYFVVEL